MRKRFLTLFLAVVIMITSVCPLAFAQGTTYNTTRNSSNNPTKCSQVGIDLIKSFESCRLTAYKAVPTERYWTIGWGHYGPDVYEGMTITQEEADALFDEEIVEYETYVTTFLNKNNIAVNQSQYDALVSFTYNTGNVWVSYTKPDFRLRNYLIAGIENYTAEEIRAAFVAWSSSGGQVLAGLVRRRNAECDLFLSELNRPTNPWIQVNKSIAADNEEVTFTFGADNAAEYILVANRANANAEQVLSILTEEESYTAEFPASGCFNVHVVCNNIDGYVASSNVELLIYADLGEEFTSTIRHKAQDSYLDINGNDIFTADENGHSDQMWHFAQQSDGTYVITSCYDGRYLTVSNGEAQLGSSSHKWYIWQESRGYVLRSKSTEQVLSLGDDIVTADYDGLEPQIWEFDIEEDSLPQKPQVSIVLGNAEFETIISWTEGYGARAHNLVLWQGTVSDEEPYLLIKDAEGPVSRQLPLGTYNGYVEAYHEYGSQRSETFTFTVTANPIVKFDANGGTAAPVQQQKVGTNLRLSTAVPTRAGHAFDEWNTSPDGTGTGYAPGDYYEGSGNMVLYAIWTPISGILGDANSDTVISNSDLVMIARHIVGLITKQDMPVWINGDMNNDNDLTNADIVLLAKKIVER